MVLFEGVEMPSYVRSPDINGDGTVNILDATLLSTHYGEAGADLPADLDADGIVSVRDAVILQRWWGKSPPPAPFGITPEPPVGARYYTIELTFARLAWFNQGMFEGLVRNLIINPVVAILTPLGYRAFGIGTMYLSDNRVRVFVQFWKAGGSPIPMALIYAAVTIAALITAGVMVVHIAWVLVEAGKRAVEEERTTTAAEQQERLSQQLEQGLITPEQYEALSGQITESQVQIEQAEAAETGAGVLGNIAQVLPLILGLAVVGYAVSLMPRKKEG